MERQFYSCPKGDYFSDSPGICPWHGVDLEPALRSKAELLTQIIFHCPAPRCDYQQDRPGLCPIHATTLGSGLPCASNS